MEKNGLIRLYAVKDVKLAFAAPVALPNDEYAVRCFEDAKKRKDNTDLCNHPEDFQLWYIGALDEQTGDFVGGDEKKCLA